MATRDYKKEYKNYHGKSKQRKERASRTKAREEMIKKGKAKKGDGKDIDHKKALRSGGSNGINNLRVRDRSSNRSDNGHHKGETQNKDSWKWVGNMLIWLWTEFRPTLVWMNVS